MWGRSSACSAGIAVAVVGVVACAKRDVPPAGPPEGDPAAVAALASALIGNAPNVGGVPDCAPGVLRGGLPMTEDALLRLARRPVPSDPEHAPWMNPVELDAPAVRALAGAGAGAATTATA